MRDENSLGKGKKRKRKTATLAIQGCPNAATAINKSSPSPLAITQQFQETETLLTRAVYETPNNNNGTDPVGHLQSHCAEFTRNQPLTISSSQECVRGESSLRKGRYWTRKTAPLAIQSYLNGCDEKHNKHPTELQSADYTVWFVKDRLIGKITCMICGEEGHYTCDCPMKDQENKVMCTLCNKVGHCYLWCCRQHVSENRACRRCGEKGYYTNKDLGHYDEKDTNMYVMCSSCDESHLLGRCPMGKVTCFLCDGKGHVPAQCRFSPMLTVTQYYQESFRAILKQALAKKSRRAVKSAKLSNKLERHDDSHECQFKRNDKMVHTVSSFIHCEKGDCEENRSDCKKPPGEMLCDVKCHDEGHYSSSCPKNATPGQCHGEGHNAKSCPKSKKKRKKEQQKQDDDKKLLNGGTSSKQGDCEKNRGDCKKPPGELLCDVKCENDDKKLLNDGTSSDQGDCEKNRGDCKKPLGELLCVVKCHDEGHDSSSCPKNTTPVQCHGEGHNAKSSTKSKKKRKKEQQKQNDDKKLLNGGTS